MEIERFNLLSSNFNYAGKTIYLTCLQLYRMTSKGRVVFQELPLGKEKKLSDKFGLKTDL